MVLSDGFSCVVYDTDCFIGRSKRSHGGGDGGDTCGIVTRWSGVGLLLGLQFVVSDRDVLALSRKRLSPGTE